MRFLFIINTFLALFFLSSYFKSNLYVYALILFLIVILSYYILYIITKPGTIRNSIMNVSEHSFFESRVNVPNNFQQKEISFPRFPLPKVFLWIVVSQFMTLLVPYILSNLFHVSFISSPKFITLILLPIGYFCIGVGLFIHFQPNSNRERKYTYLFIGEGILVIIKPLQHNLQKWDIDLLDLWIGNFIIVLFLFGVVGTLLTWWIKSNVNKRNNGPSSSIRKTYGLIRKLTFGPFPFLTLVSPAGTMLLLIFRYLLTEYMLLFPIVYLRSFHYKESSEVFADLIAPEASKFGVIIGLVHEKQKGSDIFARTHIANQGQTFTISDELWQEWVIDKLKRCSAVIIDSSVGSESVHWEVVTANKLVDPSRIIILQREGTESVVTSGNRQLVYALNSKSLKDARRSFRKILKDIFAESPEQIKKSINAKKNN